MSLKASFMGTIVLSMNSSLTVHIFAVNVCKGRVQDVRDGIISRSIGQN